MGSIFVNAGLAAGVALAAVPVILHLFMKQTPKHVVFPALRLIRERQKRSRKKLRIKNWLLLLARMALLALMALALARPRIDAKIQAGAQEVPTAIALVFDTSLSMGYKERDKTRLDEAKTHAEEILQRTHSGSQIFVVDSAEPGVPPALSPAAARKRIASLTLQPANRPLNRALGQAYEAVVGSDRPLKEVYVLTDLARSAWELNQQVEGLDKVAKIKEGVSTYVIRLAPKDLHDVAVVSAETATGLATQDEPIPILAKVRASGKPADRVVEFWVDGQKKDQKIVNIPADGEVDVPPFAPKLPIGLHRVEVHLDGEPDPLNVDDTYYLTLDVQPALKVLVVSDLIADADFVANALDPEILRNQPGTPRPFHVERVLTSTLGPAGFSRPLKEYACVFLLDVRELEPALWSALTSYVKQGGGLVVSVGNRLASNVDAYNEGLPGQLLPAKLGTMIRHAEDFHFGRADITHPLFSQNPRDLLAELGRAPVYKSLSVEPAKDARTILSYQDGTPALVERIVPGARSGHVLLWTTALARVPETTVSWNDFPVGNWAFFQVMNQSIPYLSGTGTQSLVAEAGEDVSLPIDPTRRFTDYNAHPPGNDQEPFRLNPPTGGGPLIVPGPAIIGQWSVTASGPGTSPLVLGFSVNTPAAETRLTTLENKDLDTILGKGKYQLAESPEELKKVITETRIGREIYPWIMLFILLIVTLENVLANTFYREKTGAPAPVPARA